jgi:hypothetical protein
MSLADPGVTYGVLALLAVLATLSLSRLVKNPLLLVASSAIVASALFQMIVRFQLGYFDKFWGLAFGISLALTGTVSALTLWAIGLLRAKQPQAEQNGNKRQ